MANFNLFQKSLAVYEAQWKSWREQLIQNREKLRKRREEASKQQPNHVGISQPIVHQAAQAIKNSDIQGDLHQPQMPNVPQQHSLYANPLPNINTQLNESGHSAKLPNQRQLHYESGNDRQVSGIHSSGNLPLPQFDRSSEQFREDRDQRIQHSNLQPYHIPDHRVDQTFRQRFEQGQVQDPLFPGSNQQNSDPDLRQWQPDITSSVYSNRNQHDRNQQSMIPPNQRDLKIPTAFQFSRGVVEPSHDAPDFVIPEGYEESRPSVSSNETAAELFRKRALRGKIEENHFARFPEVQLDRRLLPDGSGFTGNARPRIEERLAEYADIKLSALPQPRLEEEYISAPSSRDCEMPHQKVKSLTMEPIVFEYNHRPGRYGRFATVAEPVFIDYSHGKPSRVDSRIESESKMINRKTELQTTSKLQENLPIKQVIPKKENVEKSPIKSAPPPLFPSAAAIQVNENQFQKPKPSLPPEAAFESNIYY